MRILYVAPRFHTNMEETVKGFIDCGDKVEFWVNYKGKTESYDVLSPVMMKPFFLFSLYIEILRKKYGESSKVDDALIRYFFPSLLHTLKKIKLFSPDIVILRERNVASLIITFLCRTCGIKKVLLYDQTELYLNKSNFVPLKKRIIRKAFPSIRYTPVVTHNFFEYKNNPTNFKKDENAFFLPLVAKSDMIDKSIKKEYKKSNTLHILDVGKYRNYKNHQLLIEAVSEMKNKERVKITIVGQCSLPEEEEYFDALQNLIMKKGLDKIFTLQKNYPFSRMKELYSKNDVLVLTSLHECANVSICEAMASEMVAISPDTNGTASYLDEGAGYIYKENDAQDLSQILDDLSLKDAYELSLIGKTSRKRYEDNYSFRVYKEQLLGHLSK